MPGVSIPSIIESKLWPICVHTRATESMPTAVIRRSRRHFLRGSHTHLSIKKVWNIRISLKCAEGWVFGWCTPVIFFVNSDVFLQCVLRSNANREHIAFLLFFYWWSVACTERWFLDFGANCAKKSAFLVCWGDIGGQNVNFLGFGCQKIGFRWKIGKIEKTLDLSGVRFYAGRLHGKHFSISNSWKIGPCVLENAFWPELSEICIFHKWVKKHYIFAILWPLQMF